MNFDIRFKLKKDARRILEVLEKNGYDVEKYKEELPDVERFVERRRQRRNETKRKYNQRPEVRAHYREYQREYEQRPEVRPRRRAQQREWQRKYDHRPEVIERRREYARLYYQRPEVAERRRRYFEAYRKREEFVSRQQTYRNKYIKRLCREYKEELRAFCMECRELAHQPDFVFTEDFGDYIHDFFDKFRKKYAKIPTYVLISLNTRKRG